jgi:hypothetical protein
MTSFESFGPRFHILIFFKKKSLANTSSKQITENIIFFAKLLWIRCLIIFGLLNIILGFFELYLRYLQFKIAYFFNFDWICTKLNRSIIMFCTY